LVTEPTVSGVHDLERILATVNHFRVPALVLINKADVNPRYADAIRAYCAQRRIPLIAELPFDTVVTEAMVQGWPVTLHQPEGPVSHALGEAWGQVRRHLDGIGQ
jgi:MinD superfamily P-loop ATPase